MKLLRSLLAAALVAWAAGSAAVSPVPFIVGSSGGAAVPGAGYVATAWDFDGTNDYTTRGANLTGVIDGKQGSFSAWVKVGGTNGTFRMLFSNATTVGGATNRATIFLNSDNKVAVAGVDASGNTILHLISTSGIASGTGWLHILASWDLATPGARHLYISDVDEVNEVVFTNANIDYAGADWSVGALPSGANKWTGGVAELWFDDSYLDFSVEANRRKFISDGGAPVSLGADGSVPTGAAPAAYTKNFAANLGAGGDFTVAGALVASASVPSAPVGVISPSALVDNGYSTDRTRYFEASPFSRLVVSTAATQVTVRSYIDPENFDDYGGQIALAGVGVWDGTTKQTITPTVGGYNAGTLTLAAGTKTVEILTGQTTRPNGVGDVMANYLTAVEFNATTEPVAGLSNPSERILIYGDSITVGSSASAPTNNSWAMLLRELYSGSVMLEAWGWRSLYEDAPNAAGRTALSNRIASYAPTIVWLAIGTNDYGLAQWNATEFETGYADFLDKLHAALPSAAIYAQTPIVRGSEGGNGVGSTLGNYRTAISNACATRAWATLVDGTAFMTTSELEGGDVHPTTTGHGLYYLNVADELGISPGSLQFSASNYNVNDNAGSVTITVSRTLGSVGAIAVNYATSNGTATQPGDYTAASGTLNWADGETANKTFQVSVVNDLDAGSETVNLTLSAPTGNAVIGAQGTATITIVPSL
jgi:lysophospholipase L1-like esterase